MENKILKVILSFIIIALGAAGIYFNLTTEVPTMKYELLDGSIVEAEDVASTRMLKSQIPAETFLDGKEMIGKEVQGTIASGLPVYKVQLKEVEKPSAVNDETIAIVPIPVDSTHVPAKLQEGDLVNVIVFFSEGEEEAFAIGYDYIATVSKITKDADGNVVRVDIVCDKELSVDLAASVSLGNIFIIQNEDMNDVKLEGTTAKDLYEKYYSKDQGEITDIQEENPAENGDVEGE